MDQGWAALLAACVGLVGGLGGSLAGGYAAIRGAREGAERAARAGLEQAAHQAREQYEHWLRQERRVAYTEMLTDADDFQMKLADLVNCTQNPDDLRSLLQASRDVHMTVLQLIKRVGPVVTIGAPGVTSAFRRYVDKSRAVSQALRGRDPVEFSAAEVQRLYEEIVSSGTALTLSVAADVKSGPAREIAT